MIAVKGVMTVIDIHLADVSDVLLRWFVAYRLAYSNEFDTEHLYSTRPHSGEGPVPKEVQDEFDELINLADEHGARYIRFYHD